MFHLQPCAFLVSIAFQALECLQIILVFIALPTIDPHNRVCDPKNFFNRPFFKHLQCSLFVSFFGIFIRYSSSFSRLCDMWKTHSRYQTLEKVSSGTKILDLQGPRSRGGWGGRGPPLFRRNLLIIE